jgi:FkbM family methyltransferase
LRERKSPSLNEWVRSPVASLRSQRCIKSFGVEPDPEFYALAEENVKQNKLEEKVILLQAALSSTEGKVNFLIPVSLPNASSLKPTEDLSKTIDFGHAKQMQVKTVAL